MEEKGEGEKGKEGRKKEGKMPMQPDCCSSTP